jgi:ribosomal protein S17
MANLVKLYSSKLKYKYIYDGMLLRIKTESHVDSNYKVGDIVEVIRTRRCNAIKQCPYCHTHRKVVVFALQNRKDIDSHTTCFYKLTDISGRAIDYE